MTWSLEAVSTNRVTRVKNPTDVSNNAPLEDILNPATRPEQLRHQALRCDHLLDPAVKLGGTPCTVPLFPFLNVRRWIALPRNVGYRSGLVHGVAMFFACVRPLLLLSRGSTFLTRCEAWRKAGNETRRLLSLSGLLLRLVIAPGHRVMSGEGRFQ